MGTGGNTIAAGGSIREIRSLQELPDVRKRETCRSEKLFPQEEGILNGFLAQAAEFQQYADEEQRPIYIRFIYNRGFPEKGEFQEFNLRRNELVGAQITKTFTDETAKMGPIFCVYPTNAEEVFLKNEKGQLQAAGIAIGENNPPVWFPEILDKQRAGLYEGFDSQVRKNSETAIIDDQSVNVFVSQLLATAGDEEVRPFLCGYRNGKFMLVTPGIDTVSSIKSIIEKADVSGVALFFIEALRLGVYADVGPIDAIKYSLKNLSSNLDLRIIEGVAEQETLLEIFDKSDERLRMSRGDSPESEIIAQVAEAFRKARVPKNSVVLGNLMEMLYSVGLGVQSLGEVTMAINVSIPEFAAVLKGLKAYGLEFMGSTLPYIPRFDSKLTPALEARFAGLPFPFMKYVVKKGSTVTEEVINDGELFPLPVQNRVFLHKSRTSTKQGIQFVGNVDPKTYIPEKDGEWVVMQAEPMADIERRLWYHPAFGVFLVKDRVVVNRKDRTSELVGNGHVEKEVAPTLTKEELLAFQEYIAAHDTQAITRVVGDTEWALEYVERIRQLYFEAGILPTLGLFGYDILWAIPEGNLDPNYFNPENPLLKFGVPFVSEMHDNFVMEDVDSASRALFGTIKEKFKGRPWVVPEMGYTLMHILLLDVLKNNLNGSNKSKATQLDLEKIYVPKGVAIGGPFVDIHHNRKMALAALQEFVRQGSGLTNRMLL